MKNKKNDMFGKKRLIVCCLIIAGLLTILFSCNSGDSEYVDLSNKYWYKNNGGGLKIIVSRVTPYNSIYPQVVDFSFNDKFIIAKQIPDKDLIVQMMGENNLRRYQFYKKYKKDSALFDLAVRNKVIHDSDLYRKFISRGSPSSEEMDLKYAILIAQSKVDSIYKESDFGVRENYWIIINSIDSLIGPLSKEQYLGERKRLNIPESIKLKFEKQ